MQPLGGSDKISSGKVIYILAITLFCFVLTFTTINTVIFQKSIIYLVLAIFALVFWTISQIVDLRKGYDFPNPITFESGSVLVKKYKPWHYVILFLIFFNLGAFIFFAVSASPANAIVGTIQFQLLPITTEINALVTIGASLIEDLFFFGIISVIIGGLLYKGIRNEWISIPIAIVLTAMVFMGYHVAVYGEVEIALSSVFMFGIFMAAAVLITKTLFASFVHAGNNLGVLIFTHAGVEYSTFFWIIMLISIVLGLYVAYKIRDRL